MITMCPEITPEFLASQNLSPTFQERFWKKIHKTDTCWLWTGAMDGYGYGVITRRSKGDGMIKSHRAAWILYHGNIPDGLCICHTCDVRNCVRKEHLFIGTRTDNAMDMIAKKRNQKGSRNGMSKLSECEVVEIIDLLKNNPYRCGKKIADMFGVGKQIISQIKSGTRWAHISRT